MRKFMNNKGLLVMLSAVMAMTFTACGNDEVAEEEVEVVSMDETEDLSLSNATELGEGALSFTFTVVYESGVAQDFLINTDAVTVGEALMEHDLISGTDGEWGLMVDTVGEVTLDFDATGQYWGFFVNGNFADTGVDTTEVVDGEMYSFEVSQ